MKINYHHGLAPKANNNKKKHNNRLKRLLLKASSYLNIGHSNFTSCRLQRQYIHSIFIEISFNKKISKKIVRIQSPLVNPIYDLERPFDLW